ncbi:MAG: transcriptional regulator [Candidatus Riflebacteria bacterium RBG_13_59_9]|jgi:ArsR family transcriptional regulator|nr:MAG: transcriptional regulator [Candidatus Riflebacteria bacterium RBG_13_59_9]
MDPKIKARYESRARIIKAMSHPTRLFMVDELSKGERCVCELTEMVGDDISTISKHLSILKSVGIVSDEKRGTQVFYSLRAPCVLNFFSCVESVLKTNAREQAALAD